jgi:hypothetical protein
MSPRLHDGPIPDRRRPIPPPVVPAPGPHRFRLYYYGAAEDETVTAMSSTEAYAARKAPIRPAGIMDLTEVGAWMSRHQSPQNGA